MHKHEFIKAEFDGYEKCVSCGSYHSVAPVNPKEIYEEKPYWGDGTGRSTPEQQASNLTCTDDCGISKVDRVLQFVPYGKRVLEIGCFPGTLLKRLFGMGYVDVIGIEPSKQYAEYICNEAKGAVVVQGYFPEILRPSDDNLFHCIIGMDVMEHVDDYADFFQSTHRLLVPGGTAVFMSPLIFEDGFVHKKDFKADEHLWIFSKQFLREYLENTFSEVKFARWIVGHELIILKK
jgi:2-polyprenyl-3-methyl-5-hydroxy-6-metoxy-1,4-benzoquinol methylase